MGGVFLGLDTSNYTTSLATCSEDGEILLNLKKLLPVPKGQKGLRQSDALFHHTVQLPVLFDKASKLLRDKRIIAVGVSSCPRDAEGSYMPCFLAGVSAAKAAAFASGAAYVEFSHQCGHIAAALYSAGRQDLFCQSFAAFHVSGGTTDILLVTPGTDRPFNIRRIGGTKDINAGQAIDRAGVLMGLSFPCGAELEAMALENKRDFDAPKICVTGLECNLSGIENKTSELFEDTGDKNLCAAYVIDFVRRTLRRLSENLREQMPDIPIIYAGGVMSCSIIRKDLSALGSFAEPIYSSDNAAGIALLTQRKYANG